MLQGRTRFSAFRCLIVNCVGIFSSIQGCKQYSTVQYSTLLESWDKTSSLISQHFKNPSNLLIYFWCSLESNLCWDFRKYIVIQQKSNVKRNDSKGLPCSWQYRQTLQFNTFYKFDIRSEGTVKLPGNSRLLYCWGQLWSYLKQLKFQSFTLFTFIECKCKLVNTWGFQ